MLHEVFVPLVLAIGCGLVIGIERNYRGRSAGISTYMLVSAGACLFVLVGQQVEGQDSGRVVSQIVTGIGFIGAGCIIKDGMTVKGFTTAATIWCSAAIGSLCAYQRLTVAALATGSILLINLIFHPLALLIEQYKAYDRRDDLMICQIRFIGTAEAHRQLQTWLMGRSRSRHFAIGGESWQPLAAPASSGSPTLPEQVPGQAQPPPGLRQVDLTLKSRYHFHNELMQLISDVGSRVQVVAVDWIVQ